MASDCIFCRIVAGQLPSLKVYEDADALAFLDIGPLAEGHLLVIPKQHFARLNEMTPDALGHLARQLPRLAAALVEVTGADGYNLLQNNGKVSGQAVDHVHFHLIPRKQGDGLGYRWPASSYGPGRGEELQRQFTEALRS